MDSMFLKADGSGRSLFCLCGSYLDTGSIAASGCRFLVPSLLYDTSVTGAGGMSRGEDVDDVMQGDGSKWQRDHEGS